MTHDLSLETIRIGTLVNTAGGAADYIRQILPHGFESFQLTYGDTLGEVRLEELAPKVREVLGESGAVISSLGVYSNPLESDAQAEETRRTWRECIDKAHLFGADLVCGFTGRVRGRPLPESLPRFKEVFGELAKRAADKGVRIAFENCWMGGNWASGDWNIAHSPDAWELMFDALPDANVGLEWEPCHQICALMDPLPQLRKWVPRIFHVHGKDASVYRDVIAQHGIGGKQETIHHRTPGFGDTNWADVISELRRHGFKGSIDIEGWHDPVYKDALEMTGQVAALHHLKRCRGGFYVENPAR